MQCIMADEAAMQPTRDAAGLGMSFRRPGVPECDQLGELLLLLGDPVRGPGFIAGTGVSRGLFDQVDDVLPYHGDPFLKLAVCRSVVHRPTSGVGGAAAAAATILTRNLHLIVETVQFWTCNLPN
jgi:hypothetical protein